MLVLVQTGLSHCRELKISLSASANSSSFMPCRVEGAFLEPKTAGSDCQGQNDQGHAEESLATIDVISFLLESFGFELCSTVVLQRILKPVCWGFRGPSPASLCFNLTRTES